MPDFFHSDGLPLDADLSKEVGPLVKKYPWESCSKDMVAGLVYAKRNGAKKYLCLGFCWGAYVVFKGCATDIFLGGASFHPAV